MTVEQMLAILTDDDWTDAIDATLDEHPDLVNAITGRDDADLRRFAKDLVTALIAEAEE